MTADTLSTELAYYARHGAALFPIPAGSKAPHGLVGSFKHDHSADPKQWARWQTEHPGCNFGVVAFASQWIICDIDTSGGEEGRAEAWRVWSDLCVSWGLSGPLSPHCQSQSGGWHCYLTVPPHIDASTLRQPDAVKGRINLRCVGYTVAAGSTFEGRPYVLFPDAPAPHPAPDALIAHCSRVPRKEGVSKPGNYDFEDAKALYRWLFEHEAFTEYMDWVSAGMIAKIEFGDRGLDLWSILCHDQTVDDGALTKWGSFASEPTENSQTLGSLLKLAHDKGWKGSVRKTTNAMFSEVVAQIAADAGASLASGGMPMMAGQAYLTELAAPILADFLAGTPSLHPLSSDFPMLPDAMSGHGLFAPMQDCIARVVAMSEPPAKLKPSRVTDVLAVLSILHPDVFEALCRRIRAAGHVLQDRKIRLAAANLSERVERITVTHDKWEYDPKSGAIEADNPDNVLVLLGVLGLELRWNAWTERMEVQGTIDSDFRYPDWTYVDDVFVAKLITRAKRTKTRFKLTKDFTWESLITFAHANTVDPVLDILSQLQGQWDGTDRLAGWLSRTCGVADDPYHRAVSLNIIGGMVRRIRQPGCKHDSMSVLFGPQGTGKSTIAKIIADMGQSTLAQIERRSAEYFSDEILLGDASKELVLSLAGKCLVEIGEMGQKNSANIDHIKAMLSRQVDRGRTAYARSISNRPRRNIFFGTVNGDQPLQDATGNRRFLPVSVPRELDLAWLSDNIRALVGEAAAMEAAGADFAIPREVWGVAAEHQEAARSQSDLEVMMDDWFGETAFTKHAFVTSTDLVELGHMAGWRNVQGLGAAIMRKLGFRAVHTYVNGNRTRGWLRGPDMLPREIEKVTRYVIGKTQDGRPRVTIRMGMAGGVGQLPPLPY